MQNSSVKEPNTLNLLRKIGDCLERNIFPNVSDGGIVQVPSDARLSPLSMGTEKSDGYSTRRSEARSRERPTRWEGSTQRSWTSGKTSQVIRPSLQSFYEEDLGNVCEAYPDTRVWRCTDGLWLLSKSRLIEGLDNSVTFLTGLSYTEPNMVRSWGFWAGAIWIGPRHTNFPDGSICAYEPRDFTWQIGESLVPLLDLYCLWALRQFHLQEFGYWPGKQSVHLTYERLNEFEDCEFCGCGSDKKYPDCCKLDDLSKKKLSVAIEYITQTGGTRSPPREIISFMQGVSSLPSLLSIYRTGGG